MRLPRRLRGSRDEPPWPGYPSPARIRSPQETEELIQALVDGRNRQGADQPEQPGRSDGWTYHAEVIEVRGDGQRAAHRAEPARPSAPAGRAPSRARAARTPPAARHADLPRHQDEPEAGI